MQSKRWLLWIFKFALSALAIYFVVKAFSKEEILSSIKTIKIPQFLGALLLYLLSQWISSNRLLKLIEILKININKTKNFALYLIGMSYNLFLPGGIGGDAYKQVYYKKNSKVEHGPILSSLILDRLCGLAAILILIAATLPSSSYSITRIKWFYALAPILFLAASFLLQKFFVRFKKAVDAAIIRSLIIQILQVLAAFVLASSFSIFDIGNVAVVFLISSVATAIPVFLGGFGARELVFLQLAPFFSMEPKVGVAIAIAFSLVVLLASIPGLFIDYSKAFRA